MYNVYQIDTCNREDNMSQSHVEHESSDIACNFGEPSWPHVSIVSDAHQRGNHWEHCVEKIADRGAENIILVKRCEYQISLNISSSAVNHV